MNQKFIRLCAIAFFIVLLLTTGCSSPAAPGNITDDLGRNIQIESIPDRIVSLAPSNTEILFALGLGEKVVGVTDYCNYPDEAQEKPSIGGFSTVNIEAVVALEPDLILATDRHSKTVIPALENLGYTVVALSPETLDWHDPLMTAGTGTLAYDVITTAGGINIAGDISGDNTISLETVIDRNPQIIVASVGMGSGEDLPWQYVQTEERLKTTDALKTGQVYKINGDLIHRAGPRIVDALEIMAQFFHPELFK
ncbi:MAG: helical backbone metal receptor [Dehalococcoidia bacterium]